MKKTELKSIIREIISEISSNKKVITEMTEIKNEKIFCQLILAIFQDKLKFKIEENIFSYEPDDLSEVDSTTGDGNILVSFPETQYSTAIEFNFDISKAINDKTDLFLDDIEIKAIYLYNDEGDELSISFMYPVKLFATYLISRLSSSELHDVEVDDLLIKTEKKIQSDFSNVKLNLETLKMQAVKENKNAKRKS